MKAWAQGVPPLLFPFPPRMQEEQRKHKRGRNGENSRNGSKPPPLRSCPPSLFLSVFTLVWMDKKRKHCEKGEAAFPLPATLSLSPLKEMRKLFDNPPSVCPRLGVTHAGRNSLLQEFRGVTPFCLPPLTSLFILRKRTRARERERERDLSERERESERERGMMVGGRLQRLRGVTLPFIFSFSFLLFS